MRISGLILCILIALGSLPTHVAVGGIFDGVAAAIPYLDDPDDDSESLSGEGWTEIKRVEVEGDAVIIVANPTEEGYSMIEYYLFFDTNLDNITDVSWRYYNMHISIVSLLYNFSSGYYYCNGTWCAEMENFEGEIEERGGTGETVFHLEGAISGEVRLKVASVEAQPWLDRFGGDLVPNCGVAYDELRVTWRNPMDDEFLYPEAAVTIASPEEEVDILSWIIIIVVVVVAILLVGLYLLIRRRSLARQHDSSGSLPFHS